MSQIRSKDTKLAMAVRRHLHVLGFRYRLHSFKLPGHPGLVLSRWHTVIKEYAAQEDAGRHGFVLGDVWETRYFPNLEEAIFADGKNKATTG